MQQLCLTADLCTIARLDTARQGANPESSLCQDQQKHDKSAMTWHQNAEPRLYISILKEEGIRMSSKPMLSQKLRRYEDPGSFEGISEVQVSCN